MSVIIRLQNLPWSANASHIRRFFSGLNIPEGGVHIVGGENGDAFIGFASDDDARRCMYLDGQALNGASVKLMLSSVAEMQSVITKARGHFESADSVPPPAPIPKPNDQGSLFAISDGKSNNHSKTFSYFDPKSDKRAYNAFPHAGAFEEPHKEMTQPPRPPEIFDRRSAGEMFPVPDKINNHPDKRRGVYPINSPDKPVLPQRHSQENPQFSGRNVDSFRNPIPGGRPTSSRHETRDSQEYGARRGHHSNDARHGDTVGPDRAAYNQYGDERRQKYEGRSRDNNEPYASTRDRDYKYFHTDKRPVGNDYKRFPESHDDKPQVFDYGHHTNSNQNEEKPSWPSKTGDGKFRPGNVRDPYDSTRRGFVDRFDQEKHRFDSDDREIRRPHKPFDRPRPADDLRQKLPPFRDERNDFVDDFPSRQFPGNDPRSARPYFRDENPTRNRNDVNQPTPNYPPRMEGGFIDPVQFDKPAGFRRNESDERDFSVRPPWLTSERENSGNSRSTRPPFEPNGFRQPESNNRNVPPGKALMPTPHKIFLNENAAPKRMSNDFSEQDQPPPKLYRPGPRDETNMTDSETVIRLSTLPEKINIGALFQFLRGVKVVLKWGVRAENDKMNRPTGYVFIKCQTSHDAEHALTFNNQMFNGFPAVIVRSSDDEFYSSGDSYSFRNIPVPAHVTKGQSYFYQDNCMEITGLKKVVSKELLKNFFDLKKTPDADIFIGDFSSQMTVFRIFMKLHSKEEVEKVSEKSGVVFEDYGTLRTWPISILQFEKYKKDAKKEFTTDETNQTSSKSAQSKSPVAKKSPVEAPPVVSAKIKSPAETDKNELKCLEISNLPKFATESEVKLLFPYINLKVNPIHLIPKCNKAVIEFGSSAESKKSLFTTRRVIRGISVIMKQISESAKDLLIESKTNNSSSSEVKEAVKPESDSKPNSSSNSSKEMEPPKPVSLKTELESPTKKPSQRYEVTVTNLPMGYTADRIKEFFKGFALFADDPVVLKLSSQGKPLGEATIAFKTAIEADRAIRDLNGRRLAGRSIAMKSLF